MRIVYKFLPLFVIVALIVSVYFYIPLKRNLAYKFGFSGDPTTACCPVPNELTDKGDFDEGATAAVFNTEEVDYPKTSLAQANPIVPGDTQVLGTTTASGEEKWIEVSLDKQQVTAWEGNRVVMQFPISSGLWSATPKGDFNIWYKTRYQKMEGGKKELGTYYNLPNVPSNMFFYKGYALHGAYWHNNFGQPMSHGCVNEPLAQAAAIFEWAGPVVPEGQNYVKATPENPGTRVYIH
jgi:lipoprotein-anchoring transpeptidase ErfK/SrfK